MLMSGAIYWAFLKQYTNLKSVYILSGIITFMLPIKYLNTPRMGSPFCTAILLFISRTAPAPSLTWLELPKTHTPSND